MQISRSGPALTFFGSLLCPFDDGNRLLTRVITGLGLAQSRQQAILFYAMTATILDDRAGYHRILEAIQKGTLDNLRLAAMVSRDAAQ